MSYQVCHCGWSKVTTYQGLRIHQGKMGCTAKGLSIPESEQFRFNTYIPKFSYVVPPIEVEEPFMTIISPPFSCDTWRGNNREETQKDRRQITWTAPVKKENPPVSSNHGTRTNQEAALEKLLHTAFSILENQQQTATNTNKTQQALEFPGGAQASLTPLPQIFGAQTNPEPREVTVQEANKSVFGTPQHNNNTHQTATNARPALDFSTSVQQASLTPMRQIFGAQMNPEPREVTVQEANKPLFGTSQHNNNTHQTATIARPGLDFSTSAQQASLTPLQQIFGTQTNAAPREVTVQETNKPLFETPQHNNTNNNTHQTATNARRALDFSTSVQQVEQLVLDIPTTTAQETFLQKEREREREQEREWEREQEREQEREKEREAQKLQKARQDRMKADLQQKIQMRENKMSEVKSSVKACKGSLDAEWLEINNVFLEAMRVVEDTRQKALQPLEDRRQRVKREGQKLIQKLQKEVDKLKNTIDELDKNPDLQVCPPAGLDESRDWKNVTVDTSFSFGTLRAATSDMMEEIHQELQELSSLELRRASTFAVDVQLDPSSAHRCLVLSPDGKTVRDGAQNQKVPDTPQRFDMFGSILGLNRLSYGKSYWEVEVRNKRGWDLGVARGDANRKGKLTLSPDNGYWVTVHFEGKKYAALTAPPVSLALKQKPQKVGVFVDYEEGLVSFYDVAARSHIYSFTECSFGGEVFPYFSPHLKRNETNGHPLVISTVKKQ